jgi:hypothetical protein
MPRPAPKPPRALADLANVGPAALRDFRTLGICTVAQLAKQDPFRLYERLCHRTGQRHDPCVIDVFMATIAQSQGAAPRPWWKFTARRKRVLAEASATPARRSARRS